MEWLLFSKLSIQIFTQFVLSLMITAYLVSVRGKSAPTKILLVFFSLFTLTLLGDLLQFSLDASWSFYVGAVQNGLGIASVVALMQFAYWFPENHYRRESRWALWVFGAVDGVTAAGGAYALIQSPVDERLFVVMGVVLMVNVLWIIGVFVRKMMLYSDVEECKKGWRHCCAPSGRPARALRAFAALTLVWLLVSGAVVLEGLGVLSAELLLQILSAGILIFLFAFVLVYMNNAPEPSSFTVKMVGLSLVIVLLTMGDMASFVLQRFEEGYNRERLQELSLYRRTVAAGSFSALPRAIRFVDVHYLPEEEPKGQPVFARGASQRDDFHREYAAGEFTRQVIDQLRVNPTFDPNAVKEWVAADITRTRLIDLQQRYGVSGLVGERLQFSLYYFIEDDFLYSVYYPYDHFARHMHPYVRDLIFFICAATLFVLVFLPLFVRSALLKPLRVLLEGVEKVDGGDLAASVEVRAEDEIGYLAQSFNRMVESVNAYAGDLEVSNEKLAESNRTLEERVADRTRDLEDKNGELERTLGALRETQNRLFLQEKMASQGSLVAGVAHEINNPIGVVNSAVDVSGRCIERIEGELVGQESIEALRQSRPMRQALGFLKDNNGVTRQAGERIVHIVESLKNFARLDEAQFQLADIHEGLDSALTLLGRQLVDEIEVVPTARSGGSTAPPASSIRSL
jgi:HAMP domain-containing protein